MATNHCSNPMRRFAALLLAILCLLPALSFAEDDTAASCKPLLRLPSPPDAMSCAPATAPISPTSPPA